MALERTLKLKFKTTGSSSPFILTKKKFCPAIGGAWAPWAPLSTPVLRGKFALASRHEAKYYNVRIILQL